MFRLFYVSQSLMKGAIDEDLNHLVETARIWNGQNNITGSLIFTGSRFAQILEGGEQRVKELMGRIKVDSRHHEVNTLFEHETNARQFNGWALHFSAASSYVDKKILETLDQHKRINRTDELATLYQLMVGLAR